VAPHLLDDLGGMAHLFQRGLQVVLKVTVVRQARFRLEIETDLFGRWPLGAPQLAARPATFCQPCRFGSLFDVYPSRQAIPVHLRHRISGGWLQPNLKDDIMKRYALSTLVAAMLIGGTAINASAQGVTSRLKADDHHMLFLSTSPNAPGVLMAQGAGWGLEHDAKFYLHNGFKDYYIHLWVQNVFSIAGWVGDLRISNDPLFPGRRCKFDNGTSTLISNATDWKATNAQPQSTTWAAIPGDFNLTPAFFNNSLPTSFLTPTLVPFDLGNNTNAGSPWTYYPNNISLSARYLNNPADSKGYGEETWYVAHIRCR
jgi:hypothetical protein